MHFVVITVNCCKDKDMIRKFALSILLVAGVTCSASAQRYDLPSSVGSAPTRQVNISDAYDAWYSGPDAYQPISASELYSQPTEPNAVYSPSTWIQEASKESEGGAGAAGGGEEGGGGGGGGAAAAVNPSAPLSQLQFQNVFIPESYGGSGYSNQFILQPVIAITNKPGSYFPYHIARPTFPILAPTSDPDGPLSDQGGLGDTTYFDLYVHPIKKGVNYAVGPVVILPTSTNPDGIHGDKQFGLHEWQFGPAFAYVNSARVKGLTFGFLFEAPFSLESNAYSVSVQPIFTKLLKGEKFVGIGDLAMKFDDQNGNYNIPLSIQFGKVVKAGELPLKIFLQPEYTPAGFTTQPTAKYGVKLSISVLLPGANFGYSKEKEEKRQNKRCNRGCLGHCQCN
jgi:hypothetical protein